MHDGVQSLLHHSPQVSSSFSLLSAPARLLKLLEVPWIAPPWGWNPPTICVFLGKHVETNGPNWRKEFVIQSWDPTNTTIGPCCGLFLDTLEHLEIRSKIIHSSRRTRGMRKIDTTIIDSIVTKGSDWFLLCLILILLHLHLHLHLHLLVLVLTIIIINNNIIIIMLWSSWSSCSSWSSWSSCSSWSSWSSWSWSSSWFWFWSLSLRSSPSSPPSAPPASLLSSSLPQTL